MSASLLSDGVDEFPPRRRLRWFSWPRIFSRPSNSPNSVELEDLSSPRVSSNFSSNFSSSNISSRFSSISNSLSSFFEFLRWQNFLSFLVRLNYYLRHSYSEMRKRKFNYFLGSFSCFVVVCVA